MAMNPMQRKANNYLLIGVFVTLLITGSIIGFLVYQLVSINREREEEKKKLATVYILAEDVTSGSDITEDLFIQQKISSSAIPTNAIDLSVFYDSETDTTNEFVAKINISAGTIVTDEMIVEKGEEITADVRKQEYNMLVLPSQLQTGSYVDVRLFMPNGQDYIVISKKKVTIPQNIDMTSSPTTIWLNMSEADILVMSNAIVEAYTVPGSKLYVTEYVEPGNQEKSSPTYVIKPAIYQLITADPNVVNEAKNELVTRYLKDIRYVGDGVNYSNENSAEVRADIDGMLSMFAEDALENIEDKVNDEMQKAAQERQDYLESLGG